MTAEIGSRFDRALSVLQVSNKEISELFDTSSQNISNLKKADRLNDLMSRIAIKYDINLNWLMSGSGEMFIQKDTFTQHIPQTTVAATNPEHNTKDTSNLSKYFHALESVAVATERQDELIDDMKMLIGKYVGVVK